MITNPKQEDIPIFASVWNKNVDPGTKSQLRGIPDNGDAITAAAVQIPDVWEGGWLNYQISGVSLRDLVCVDINNNDIKVITDFYQQRTLAISSSTDATPIVITTSTAHHLRWEDKQDVSATNIGEKITISGHTTNTNANGNHYTKRLTSTTFELYSDELLTTAIAGNGSGAGSGGAVDLPSFFNIYQVGTPKSIKTFNNVAQIGAGSVHAPYIVYRLLEEKGFFDDALTAPAGVYCHQGICSNRVPNSTVASNTHIIDINSAALNGSGSGYFQTGILYAWTTSLVFDGLQESDLSIGVSDVDFSNDSASAALVLRAGNDVNEFVNQFWDKRITSVRVYRAESSDGLLKNLGNYRLVRSIDINDDGTPSYSSGWAVNGNHYDLTFTDSGGYPGGGVTYEEETGMLETLYHQFVNYSLNEVGGGYHWAAKCNIPYEQTDIYTNKLDIDWDRYIFRSKKFRPNMFNWVEDFLTIDEIPIELKFYNNKLYVFSENKVYRIHPELLTIEDVFEGAGISSKGGVVSTEYGVFFCNLNGAYWLKNGQITSITDSIKVSLGNYIINWATFAEDSLSTPAYLGRILVSYLSDKRCVVFMGNDTTAITFAFIFYVPTQEWFTWSFGGISLDTNSGVITGKNGELYFSSDTNLKKLLGGAGFQDFDWVSKEHSLNEPSQDKLWKKIKWDAILGTGSLTVKYNTEGADPVSGTTATDDEYINIYKKTFQVYLDGGGNAKVDSLDILVRRLQGLR